MSACFLTALSEMIRLTLLTDTESPELTITLEPVENQGNRARAGARFYVSVALSWGADYADTWANGVQVVDARGYPLVWQFADVGKWLVKALSGVPCVVTVRITDAAQVPAKWTPARVAAAALKVSGVDVADVQAAAAAKVASVQTWAASPRKTAVMDAAQKMMEAAVLLLAVQGVQTGGDGGGGGTTYPLDLVGLEDAPTLYADSPVSSQLEQAGDVDYFRLDLGNFSFSINVERFGPEPQITGPVTLGLYDANGAGMGQWDNYLNGPVALTLPGPGIYYVSVGAHTGVGDSLGQYQITLIFNGPLP